jgi:imidazolonepropionase-like amidohydrolase
MKPLAIAAAIVALLAGFFFLLPEPETSAKPGIPGGIEPSFAIRGARVFDGEKTLEAANVIVQNGRIEAVGTDAIIPPNLLVVDGKGKTVFPGLIDSHTHSYGGLALTDALQFGVTTELDMFATPGVIRDNRARRDRLERTDSADLYSAGFLATVPMGHGTQFGIEVPTVDAASSPAAWVDARVAEGSDYIKIVYEPGIPWVLASLDQDQVRQLVQAAHARQRLAVAHISRLRPAKEAVSAGVDGLVHTFADRPIDEEFIAMTRERGAFVVPTLSVIAGIEGPAESKRFASDARIAGRLSSGQRSTLIGDWAPRLTNYRLDVALESVSKLHAAGIELLAGTDAPNPGTAHGASMHHEMELLVRAGLTPTAALAAATSVPARRFRLADRGRIAKGMRADLVLVAGDPTRTVTDARNIESVWKNGFAVPLRSAAPRD